MSSVHRLSQPERIAALRQLTRRLESRWSDVPQTYFSLDLPDIHRHLPSPGLPCGALHEVIGAAHGDTPASFGFSLALMSCVLEARRGSAFLVLSRQAADFGKPYGHGLRQLGFDVGRLLLVETRSGKDALWAMEEILHAGSGAAAVAGMIETGIDLTMSRRLSLATSSGNTPLVLLRPSGAAGTSAAMTRWRVAAAPAARDRFDAFAGWRWQVTLERCRHGRAGQWMLEWDHAAHRFRLAEIVAHRAVSPCPGQPPAFRAIGNDRSAAPLRSGVAR
jgi:protein ImuA